MLVFEYLDGNVIGSILCYQCIYLWLGARRRLYVLLILALISEHVGVKLADFHETSKAIGDYTGLSLTK